MIKADDLNFNESGLIPAIVQDTRTKEVLMFAWMNKDSLKITMEEGYTCFWSRSRKSLWRKGEESGNVQKVVSIVSDCDLDVLLIKVIQTGGACHTGERSCFFNEVFFWEGAKEFSLEKLYSLIKGRKVQKREDSYTSYLFERGDDKILKKIGEEATEVVIAAKNEDMEEMICEISDLVYHTLVLMVQKNITLDDISEELSKRHVVDNKVKQETLGRV